MLVDLFAREKFVREESDTDKEIWPEDVAKKKPVINIQHFVLEKL